MDTTTKYLTQTHAVPLIVGVRYLGNLLLMARSSVRPWPADGPHPAHRAGLGRGLLPRVASLLIGFALQRMPVAE
jgi:hypothetical protein